MAAFPKALTNRSLERGILPSAMRAVFRVLGLGLLALNCVPATGCSRDSPRAEPSIQLTIIPPAAVGGSERVAPIGGRAAGIRPDQRIVIYTKSGVWWIQPTTAQPFTTVGPDGTWQNTIHLGVEYAALLVDDGYRPANTRDALPPIGNGVVAMATVNGTGNFEARASKVLTFSGYEWDVRSIPSDRGGPNDYDPDNAWTDAEGRLHLRLSKRDGRWTSAEVILRRGLGHGTYSFTVGEVSGLDPSAALGLLTWDTEGVEQNHREMDVEISRWGDPRIPNAQYVVQPFYVPANVARFAVPPGTLTHSFQWEPGRVVFKTVRGAIPTGGAPVARHEFTSGVPTPGGEHVRICLYYFRYAPAPPQKDVEVVIERFLYVP
jgi:hypothetical protein